MIEMNQQLLQKWKQEGKIPKNWSSASCEDAGESHQIQVIESHIGGDLMVCSKCGQREVG